MQLRTTDEIIENLDQAYQRLDEIQVEKARAGFDEAEYYAAVYEEEELIAEMQCPHAGTYLCNACKIRTAGRCWHHQ